MNTLRIYVYTPYFDILMLSKSYLNKSILNLLPRSYRYRRLVDNSWHKNKVTTSFLYSWPFWILDILNFDLVNLMDSDLKWTPNKLNSNFSINFLFVCYLSSKGMESKHTYEGKQIRTSLELLKNPASLNFQRPFNYSCRVSLVVSRKP